MKDWLSIEIDSVASSDRDSEGNENDENDECDSNDGPEKSSSSKQRTMKKELRPTSHVQQCVDRWMSWVTGFNDLLARESIEFRSKLNGQDIEDVRQSRWLFHCCSVVAPLMFYWTHRVDEHPRFPATISHTIRKGPPLRIHTMFWLLGWIRLLRVMRRAGSETLKRLSYQMFFTGFWTTSIVRFGQNKIFDALHYSGATLYILDLMVMLKIFNTQRVYQRLFYTSYVILSASLFQVIRLEYVANLPSESILTNSHERAKHIKNLPLSFQRSLFWWELIVMVSENLMFTSFIHGLPSGLKTPVNKEKGEMKVHETADTAPLEQDNESDEEDEFLDALC